MPPSNPIGGNPQSRDINVKLKFSADTQQGGKAIEDLKRQTERLGRAVQDAQRDLQRLGRGGSLGGGGASGSGSMSDIGFLGRVATIGYAIDRAGTILGKAFDILSNRALSGAQKLGSILEAAANEIPIAGPLVNAGKQFGTQLFFGDSMRALEASRNQIARNTGIADLMRQRDMGLDAARFAQIGPSYDAAAINSYYRNKNYTNLINDRISGIGNLAGFGLTPLSRGIRGAQGLFSPLISGIGSLANVGQSLFDVNLDPRILQAKQNASLSQIPIPGAETELREILRNRETLNKSASQLDREIADLKRTGPQAIPLDPNNPGNRLLQSLFGGIGPRQANKFDEDRFRGELASKEAERLKLREQLKRSINMEYQKRNDLTNKIAAADRAILEIKKAELDVARDDRNRAISSITGLGSMSADARQNLLYVLQQSKQMGFQNIPEDFRNLLLSTPSTARYAQEEAFKFGMQDSTTRMIRETLGEKSFEQLDASVRELNKTIVEMNEANEKKKADQLEENARKYGSDLAASMIKFFNTAKEQFERQLRLGQQASKPPA